jgi:hypothetical protein
MVNRKNIQKFFSKRQKNAASLRKLNCHYTKQPISAFLPARKGNRDAPDTDKKPHQIFRKTSVSNGKKPHHLLRKHLCGDRQKTTPAAEFLKAFSMFFRC